MQEKTYVITESQKQHITAALLEAQAKVSFNALIIIGQLPEIGVNPPANEPEKKDK